MLKKADHVFASDIDKSALVKLRDYTPPKFRNKLTIKDFDITKKFPFKDSSFDGVFCTGTLHLFPEKVLRKIITEIDRVLKSNGRVLIDFATDIKRIDTNGKLIIFGKEPLYRLQHAKKVLKENFKNYKLNIYEAKIEGTFQGANPPYKLNCNFIILIADRFS
ncbi:MAG: class I SAM-dependent methyltransferase [Patescibacteria group bacterium]|nr:class I SAM-dependent methyltransferase [Patescibacteria group bacterium]MCL5093702.1 class I SAM-dependent methyltransferase [Patescibacteria group bacterium]